MGHILQQIGKPTTIEIQNGGFSMIQGDSTEIAFLHQPKSTDFINQLTFTRLDKSIVQGKER
jgi:hypothetical protein